ncbi:hypothetical protein CK203_109662 [Vitis vinifera]|uniref:Retrovirus-related Pol polyprotein from transposon TNT 1-94 n=1 Tax=Vitis vinifera TaxID=29760 RepID=A0A438CF70_VITVI|nr:hypothetical protein CK203_109662 [Vitis vinifera]
MASENFVQPTIPRFDEPTLGTVMTKTQRIELEGLKLKDLKAKNYLFQAIDHSILETILNKETSKQIWDSMKKKISRVIEGKKGSLLVDEHKMVQQDKEEQTLQVSTNNQSSTSSKVDRGRNRGKVRDR